MRLQLLWIQLNPLRVLNHGRVEGLNKQNEMEPPVSALADLKRSIARGKNFHESDITKWLNCGAEDPRFDPLSDEEIKRMRETTEDKKENEGEEKG